jgi:uncharacterized protein with HEPN domain
MTRHDDAARLRHMLANARRAVRLASGRGRADLDADELFNLAMTRLLEVVGEAAARVSPATRERCPNIPWPSIAGMRNRLIHGYDQVDFNVLWDVVQYDLPGLIDELVRILAGFPGGGEGP